MLTVALYGHLSAGFGLAGGAQATARLLKAAGCKLVPRDLRLSSHACVEDGDHDWTDAQAQLDLVHTNPNILRSSHDLLDVQSLRAPLRIGYWAWELEQFPQGWEQGFSDYDEIWCPSAFCAQSLAQRSPIPVVAVPHLPDWAQLDGLYRRRRESLAQRADRPVRFFCCFDYWSTTARKNPQGVIMAFQQAFPAGHESVELVIKASSASQFEHEHAAMQELTATDPRIQWIDQLLAPAAMQSLLVSADVFVSLHRSEGFGLVIADAMALGIPVIATGYSGNLEFMPPESGILLPWHWQVIDVTKGDYCRGAYWAEPCLVSAAAAMQVLANDPVKRQRLGEQGHRAVQERLGVQRLVPIVRQRLGSLLLHPSRRELDQSKLG